MGVHFFQPAGYARPAALITCAENVTERNSVLILRSVWSILATIAVRRPGNEARSIWHVKLRKRSDVFPVPPTQCFVLHDWRVDKVAYV